MATRKMFGCGLVIMGAICASAGQVSTAAAQEYQRSTINWSSTTVQTEAVDANQKPPVVTGVSLQSEGMLVAMVGDDHVVNIFDRGTGRFDQRLIEHTDWVRCAKFSPDGTKLATGGNDRRLIIWDMADTRRPNIIAQHDAAIVDIAWSDDGSKLATVGFEKKVHLYTATSGNSATDFEEHSTLYASCEDMRTIKFSPDSQKLAAGGRSGVVDLWNLSIVGGIAGNTTEISAATKADSIKIHDRRVRSISFTPNNQLVTCGDDQVVRITDLADRTNIQTLPRHGGKLFSLCVLQDNMLATGGSDNTIYIWNLETLKQVGTLIGHSGTVTSLDFKDNVLASGSYDTRVRLWTTEKMANLYNNDSFRR